ncbi:UDP-N-acetylglucosamine 1-carboxyvinyltransferase 1 [Capsulimonas corticalis]|uniref:UDP-N-acetylglucosamine 1-carboxyvinyltransferase n=1 Tax=Capsulimonas corticalis TaxID=2219043 RepID=A0A9N7L9B3_9BACT|nr:UDP-N-acetylglucosamine 1-carboxyvinyltransferase 1 [Capsulimonas corticalis]
MEDLSLPKIYTLGGNRLEGEVRISGSKNAALAILAATLLPSKGQTVLTNVPRISDVLTMIEMLKVLGVKAEFTSDSTVILDATNLTSSKAPHELIQKMRASFSVLGPLLARFGNASVALPGGCDIGARPVDYHIKGLERLGAKTTVEYGFVEASAPNGLRGADIYLDFPSVGATTHIMTAAALAEGITTISNAAEEPDVVATANLINQMGGRVRGAGTKEITIEGVKELHGTEFRVDPDRIEAGTFAVAAAITQGDLYLRGAIEEHTQPVMRKLAEAGVEIRFDDDGVRVRAPRTPLQAVHVSASPHPGFPTDMQPPLAALLTLANGTSSITETVYERRFKYIYELARMGANIKAEAGVAIIVGVPRLTGAPVAGSDLRATAALVLAGLAADGESEVSGIDFLDRGYEAFVEKLSAVGATVRREENDRAEAAETQPSGKVAGCSV